MKDLQKQKQQLKINNIIKYTSIVLLVISIALIFSQKIIALQIIGGFILILSLTTIAITKTITKKLKETIKQIEIVKIGTEEANKNK